MMPRKREYARISLGMAANLSNKPLRNTVQDVFTYEILHDGIIPEFLDTLEREAIAKFNTLAPHGYNLDTGGSNGMPSEETRQKMSEARRGENHPMYGKQHTEETRRKQSEAMKGEKNHQYGKTPSEETRQKQSEANKGENHPMYGKPSPNRGKPRPEETCRKISEAKKGKPGKPHSPETRCKLSEANKGENHPMYGKPRPEETKRKMSEAHETPERIAARESFSSLPADMPLTEKRKCLRQRFPDKHRRTIHRWCQKFDSET